VGSYEAGVGRTVLARLSEGEDLLESVTKAAGRAGISAGFFFLIGTLKKANLGFFQEGRYETTEIDAPLEIVSCSGNISIKDEKVFAHAHIVVSDEKAIAYGGHVMSGCLIGVTGELVLVEATGIRMYRRLDEKTKLSLLSMEKIPTKIRTRR
jgi:predicted DNA-binding protein with PD1-like motif